MQRVLSRDLWKSLRAIAKKAACRKAAIAYVTQDLIGFRPGDTLVVDASPHTVRNGESDAPLLRRLAKRKVKLFHCQDLHAKVILMGEVAAVGSSNMSMASATRLTEAGIATDHHSTVSAVASLIEQLTRSSTHLNRRQIDALCKIKVIRRGGRPFRSAQRRGSVKISNLGNQTWLASVHELVRDPSPEEEALIKKAVIKIRRKLDDPDFEPDWIKWPQRSRFAKGCKEGDSIIQIFKSNNSKRVLEVRPLAPVLVKQTSENWTRVYLGDSSRSLKPLAWRKFKRLLKRLGATRYVGPNSTRVLDSDLADALNRNWKNASQG